jgi:hypothetical protein
VQPERCRDRADAAHHRAVDRLGGGGNY